jgi:chemotaxis protein MotB
LHGRPLRPDTHRSHIVSQVHLAEGAWCTRGETTIGSLGTTNSKEPLMRTWAVRIAIGLSVPAFLASTGCVSKEQYEKLDAAYRKCNEHREQLQQELQAEKDNVASLNNQLASLKDQLSGKDSEISRLKTENDSLLAKMKELEAAAKSALDRSVPEPTVIVRKLPAELHKALEEFARKYPEMVEYDAKRGAVKWKGDLLFALGSDIVKDSAKASLQAFANIAKSGAASKFDVIVVGHTDNVRIAREDTKKQHPTNWHLSAHRAIAVNNVLTGFGVAPTKTGIMGYGEYRPVEPNTTEKGRQANRRVEIFLVSHNALGVSQSNGISWLKDGSLAFLRMGE